jgi:hypothetical protein
MYLRTHFNLLMIQFLHNTNPQFQNKKEKERKEGREGGEEGRQERREGKEGGKGGRKEERTIGIIIIIFWRNLILCKEINGHNSNSRGQSQTQKGERESKLRFACISCEMHNKEC